MIADKCIFKTIQHFFDVALGCHCESSEATRGLSLV